MTGGSSLRLTTTSIAMWLPISTIQPIKPAYTKPGRSVSHQTLRRAKYAANTMVESQPEPINFDSVQFLCSKSWLMFNGRQPLFSIRKAEREIEVGWEVGSL